MKIPMLAVWLLYISGKAAAAHHGLAHGSNDTCAPPSKIADRQISSGVCIRGKSYRLEYRQALKRIVLYIAGRAFILHQIPAERDPKLVGADAIIGFLPDELQLYKKSGIAIYTSSIRTSSGTGGGQCGSGSEIFLNVLDTTRVRPHVVATILIGSCDRSIELDDQDIPAGKLGGYQQSVER
jgi:hypothetical protein